MGYVKDQTPTPRAGARWTPQRKAVVCLQISSGEKSIEQAAAEFAISVDELAEWLAANAAYGIDALRQQRFQAVKGRKRVEGGSVPTQGRRFPCWSPIEAAYRIRRAIKP